MAAMTPLLAEFDIWMHRQWGQRGLGYSPRYRMYRCPAHQDEQNSLSVRDVGGKLTFHCFAGCESRKIREMLGWRNGGNGNGNHTPVQVASSTQFVDYVDPDILFGQSVLDAVWNHYSILTSWMEDEIKYYLDSRSIPWEESGLASATAVSRMIDRFVSPEERVTCGFSYKNEGSGVIKPATALSGKRVVIPYFQDGSVISINSRSVTLSSSGAKYRKLPGWRSCVYVPFKEHHKHIVVVEGEIKSIILYYHAGLPAVAVPGIGNAHRSVLEYALKHQCFVSVLPDEEQYNPAVRASAEKLVKLLQSEGVPSSLLRIGGEQPSERYAPDDILLTNGIFYLFDKILLDA